MSAWVVETVELLRNIALIAIPFVLWFATKSSEKRRATLNLIRELDKDITPYLERLFIFRKFEDGVAKNLSQTPQNPYEDKPALYYFDSVMVLNFYEAICTEIEEGVLDEELLYKGVRNSVVGAADVVLARYNDHVGSDQSRNFRHLTIVAARWKGRADPFSEIGATRVPGD
jgi:hypothetical protein